VGRTTATLFSPFFSPPNRQSHLHGCWNYDGFGNRTLEAYSTATSTPCAPGAPIGAQYMATPLNTTANNNQLSSLTYDGAGNVIQDTRNAYLYDPEGRICAVENTTGSPTYTEYLYDAEGRRVAKGSQTSLSCGAPTAANGFTLKSQYLLDAGGDQVTELGPGANPATNWVHSNIWQGGRLTGTYTSNGLHFDIADPLGTKRVQALISALGLGVPELNCLSLPFGNNVGNTLLSNCVAVGSGGTDATEHHFTGKERDTESGNDYFGARYYSSAMGRFMSPDWAAKAEPVPYAKLDNPQTLNLYAYMRNNPLGGTDPDGHCDWCQKLWNYANKNGWKTDEQVAQKGVNNNVVLVQTSSIPGNKDTKEPDNESVRHVTYTPTKIENGVLKGPVSTDPSDPKQKVSLWESNNGGSYEQQGTHDGSGKDHILTGAGILSTPVDQHWSVNGERVQIVVGKNSDGTVQTTWQLHVDRSGDVPQFTPVATPAPQ